jgi:hypothetical protein
MMPASLGRFTLGELDRLARQRPDGIKLTLPYLDKVDVPLSYPALALVAGAIGVIGNLFVLLRQRALGELDRYANRHIDAAASLEGGAPSNDLLTFGGPWAAALWPARRPPPWALIAQVASGVLEDRFASRTTTLIELGAGCVSVVVLVSLFVMGLYLSVEQPLWRLDPTLLLALCTGGGVLLMALVCFAAGTLAQRLTH